MSQKELRALIRERIETACARLIAEARAAPNPPPLPIVAADEDESLLKKGSAKPT